jgi:hypothetical protein
MECPVSFPVITETHASPVMLNFMHSRATCPNFNPPFCALWICEKDEGPQSEKNFHHSVSSCDDTEGQRIRLSQDNMLGHCRNAFSCDMCARAFVATTCLEAVILPDYFL